MHETDAEIQSLLEKELKRPLPPAIWDWLEEERYIAEIKAGELGAVQQAVKKARKLLQLSRKLKESPVTPQKHQEQVQLQGDYRALAVASLLAATARQRPDVRRFRHEVLSNQLLTLEGIPAWIKAMAEQDGPPTIIREQSEKTESRRAIHLRYADGEAILVIPVNSAGVLGRLQALSERLVKSYSWRPAAATAFVLADAMPPVAIVMGWTIASPYLATRARIRLEIPAWATEGQVIRAYRDARRWLNLDLRPISPKIATLIEFVCARMNEDGQIPEGWERAWEEWNRLYPNWPFRTWRRMCSDFHRAERELLLGLKALRKAGQVPDPAPTE